MRIIINHGTAVTAAKHQYPPKKTGKPLPAFIPVKKRNEACTSLPSIIQT
jgi:hypothetical protein